MAFAHHQRRRAQALFGRFERRSALWAPNVRGALWVLLSAVFFTAMGALAKHLGASFDSFQLAFFRALFGLFALLPFLPRFGWEGLKTRRLGTHIARAALGTAGMMCGFYALTHLAYADAVSISYARTLFLIPLAVLFLGERVRARRWTAMAVGFVGVLIMMRPTGEIVPATLVALFGAFLVAQVMVLIKKLSATERPETILFYFGCVSTLLALLPALLVWRAPGLPELALLLVMAASGAFAQYCLIRGYAVGEATAVMPFDYSRLLFAGVIGLVLFAELPDAWTLSGAAIIVASTLYIAVREARLGRPRPPRGAAGES